MAYDDAAGVQEIRDGETGFAAVAAAGRDGEDQIAEGELRPRCGLQGLVHVIISNDLRASRARP